VEVIPEVIKEEAKVAEVVEVKEPKMSDEDMMKKAYMEQVSEIKDKAMAENMAYMMNMGYYNFIINFNLLQRNNNDLVVSINKLCNNLVTESMFEQK